MRDPVWFRPEVLWTDVTSGLADCLLQHVREHRSLDDAALLASAQLAFPEVDPTALGLVWMRMQDFPYIFEVANACGT